MGLFMVISRVTIIGDQVLWFNAILGAIFGEEGNQNAIGKQCNVW